MVVPDGAFVRGEVLFDVGFVVEESGVEYPGLSVGGEGSVEFVNGGYGVCESVEDASASDEVVGIGGGGEVIDIACPEFYWCAGRAGESPGDVHESGGCVGGVDGLLEFSCDEYGEVPGAGTDV